MKILLVVPHLISFKAFLREFCRSAIDFGDEVLVVTSIPEDGIDKRSAASGARFLPISFPRGMNLIAHFYAARHFNQIVQRETPDIIQVHFSAATFTVALARRPSWPPVIATIQGMVFPLSTGIKKSVMRAAESFAFRRMDAVWVLTDDDHVQLRRLVGPERAFRQQSPGFGCDLNRFNPEQISESQRESLRNRLGIPPGDFIFIFVGRKVAFKGYPTVIRAFLEINSANWNAHLICLGPRDPLHPSGLTDSESAQIKSELRIHDLEYSEDVAVFLGISNCMIFPSQREGMAVSLMEALAMGIPVITTDARGCGDIVRHGIDGWILQKGSVSEFATAMEKLLADPAQTRRFSKAALRDRSRFSRDLFVRENRDIISSWSLKKNT